MNSTQLKKLEIISNLSFVPGNKLDEISRFIEFILFTNKVRPKKKPISVRGIWESKGFENIDIEKELKELRKDIQGNLDLKKLY
ncbi:MAG: hypothetical protein GY950_13060 [bacterium]|nr:hypothetical protein [bacterium]